MATCKKCPAEIIWCRTAAFKWIPVDAVPNVDGNLVLSEGVGDAAPLATVVDLLTKTDQTRYMPHHATCPNVKEFRK